MCEKNKKLPNKKDYRRSGGGTPGAGTRASAFDFDLGYGEMQEGMVRDVLSQAGARFEVKSERGEWVSTGNIVIEVWCGGRPSGLLVTKADWWVQVLADGDDVYMNFREKTTQFIGWMNREPDTNK